jgi:hypothetical protein
MPPPTFIMPKPRTTFYLGPWIHVPSGNVAQYLGSTSAPTKQKKHVPLVKAKNIAIATQRTVKKESDAANDVKLANGKNLVKSI